MVRMNRMYRRSTIRLATIDDSLGPSQFLSCFTDSKRNHYLPIQKTNKKKSMHSRPSVYENCLQISYMESKTTEYLGRTEFTRMDDKTLSRLQATVRN